MLSKRWNSPPPPLALRESLSSSSSTTLAAGSGQTPSFVTSARAMAQLWSSASLTNSRTAERKSIYSRKHVASPVSISSQNLSCERTVITAPSGDSSRELSVSKCVSTRWIVRCVTRITYSAVVQAKHKFSLFRNTSESCDVWMNASSCTCTTVTRVPEFADWRDPSVHRHSLLATSWHRLHVTPATANSRECLKVSPDHLIEKITFRERLDSDLAWFTCAISSDHMRTKMSPLLLHSSDHALSHNWQRILLKTCSSSTFLPRAGPIHVSFDFDDHRVD